MLEVQVTLCELSDCGVSVDRSDGRMRLPLMQRYGSTIGLNEDKIAEYRRLHAAVWPEVLAIIRDCHTRNYGVSSSRDLFPWRAELLLRRESHPLPARRSALAARQEPGPPEHASDRTMRVSVRSENTPYSIFLRRMPDGRHYLFSCFEYTGTDFAADLARMAAAPVTQSWWKLCMPCQQPLDDRAPGEWWAGAEEVFHTD